MNISGHILIIDDEASLRKTMARILQQAGFEVTTAESAEKGLDYLKTTPFDLVLTDLRMPGMQGMDALKQIHTEYPLIPVVLFTAQPDVNSAVDALRHGATDYLLKPIKPEAMIERMRSILSNQQREKRKRELQVQIEVLQSELKSLEAGEPVSRPTQPLNPASLDNGRYIKRGGLVLDMHARRVLLNDQPANIPPTSFEYLLVLVRHSPNVVDYQTLVAEAQGYQTDTREAQELAKWHIHQLRQAIESNTRNPVYLINVRGTGYRLVED